MENDSFGGDSFHQLHCGGLEFLPNSGICVEWNQNLQYR